MSATLQLAERIVALGEDELNEEAASVAGQCLLDWFGVALRGAQEPVADILAGELAGGNHGAHTLVGRSERADLIDAALINGAIGHALDYDDAIPAALGHATVPVAPVVLGLGAELGASGERALRAFLAGYETECAIGGYFGEKHYARGYHATGTIGTFGAAAAAALLLGLDAGQTARALSLAATQASGLKSLFGSMGKPLHAGRAAADGLLAARLVARGFDSIADGLEVRQGAGHVLAGNEPDEAISLDRFGEQIRGTLFKYHAACYGTHAPIEAARDFRSAHGAERIEAVDIHVGSMAIDMCNIEDPSSPLECKFSLRQTVAMALAGIDTSGLDSYSAEVAAAPELADLRGKMNVIGGFEDHTGIMSAKLEIKTGAGETLEFYRDMGRPNDDLDDQQRRLEAKYDALAAPVLGDAADALKSAILNLRQTPDVRQLMRLAAPA
ncbi:MAG: MmgE/PrpD family protein [Gammaproteobacteria bacterium AqS3]|nr:MmgE/PrpD family protein [Gammaproteobacteria bacterium AqS3]